MSCGNMVRAHRGLKEIGLDLTHEFEEIERDIGIAEFPKGRWQQVTKRCMMLQIA